MINIGSNDGVLRLRWTFNKQRKSLSLNLEDTKTNRLKAEKFAMIIEADIESNNYDPSLERYRQRVVSGKLTNDSITASELFKMWLDFKSRFLDTRTINWYRESQRDFVEILGNKKIESITQSQALTLLDKLQEKNLEPETIKRQIESLSACWDWGIKHRHIAENNPWTEIKELIKIPPRESPQPFTKEEMIQIIDGFSLYPELIPFVRFLFGTGCRLGEARGLMWDAVNVDYSEITIKRQLDRLGKIKPPKNHKNRVIQLPQSLRLVIKVLEYEEMAMYGKERWQRSNKFIFKLNNKPIGEHEFRHRWERVLRTLEIPYRKPYNTRHTFISHALEKGFSPIIIAEQTGHSPRVLMDRYAGVIQKNVVLPEIL